MIALLVFFLRLLVLPSDDKIPHHSTFSENRLHRFRESDVFRHLFERVVVACAWRIAKSSQKRAVL
jgi:hypothetical protein